MAVDIVDIVGGFVRLKKRGRNYQALCPFHTEKTPSFSVSAEKQIFHCFGCGKGGNVFTFLMEHEKMTFVEAVRHLAAKANITIKEDRADDFQRDQRDKIAYANQIAVEYFQKTLKEAKYARVLDDYLRKRRGITDEAIEHFQLGLSGEEWEGLINYASKKDISPDDLERAGLAILSDKKKKHFDRFRQRLMIPIFSISNKPIAFGGRTLKKGEMAKYINSPETPLYTKGFVLYGLNLAKDHIRDSNKVLIVEGYFDVISLWQAGIKNVVASSGTAFTPQQARLLARFAEEVYLFFDADSAGRNAAIKSVDSLYDAGLEVKVIDAPSGEDPDTLAKSQGAEKINELIEKASGFIPFRVRDINLTETGIIGREKLVKEFSALGHKINDVTRRTLFFEEAASVLGVNVDLLRTSAPARETETSSPTRARKYNPVEFEFVSLLFSNPGSIDTIIQQIAPDDLDSKELSRLYSALVRQYMDSGEIDARRLMDNAEDEQFVSLISEVAYTDWPEGQIEQETRRYVGLILEEKRKRILKKMKAELARAEAEGDSERATEILKEMKSYGF